MNAKSATEETTATITLRNYIDLHSPFIIPEYQRGYIWGKNKKDGKDAVTFMMDSLLNGFKSNSTVFIQGVTVAKTSEGTILVDGQQRTTFFYLLLKKLGWKNRFEIEYRIREESNSFLSDYNSSTEIVESAEEKYQDIFFFKKTLRIIDQKLTDVKFNEKDYETFKEYLLERVTFLYIEIPSDKAGTVFTMMNGNKAIMKPEELIKAELLRIASLNEEGKPSSSLYAREWECNMLRSRYAREWDRWLQWWNQPGVIALFRVDNTMGYLLTTYYHGGLEGKNKVSLMTFESFVNLFLKCSQPKEARETFDGLRRLQKRFEGAYNDPKTYNQIGAILRVATDADKFLNWYFLGQKSSIEELDRYYRLAFLKVKHKEIVESDTDAINNRFKECYEALQSDRLYMDNPEEAFYLLLRMNIDEDNNQEDGKGRKFDFSIWDRNDSKGRSLEHIYPKSKVYHKKNSANNETFYLDGNDHEISESVINGVDKSSYINRDDCVFTDSEGREIKASEHSIGNLVLLYKDDNSSFNNSSFEEKKTLYFRRPTEGELARAIFKSRHLLHTIYLFSNSQWTGEEIAKNKQATLKNFEEYYQSFIEK